MSTTFTHKGYGRIYVETGEEIQLVKDIIQELDSFEFSYLPEALIATFKDNYPQVVYLHKFSDLDLDRLVTACWQRGIRIWCLDTGHQERSKDHRL